MSATSPAPGPTFLVIGAARSGTTLLAHVLARHPDVFFTDPKEPHFLAFAGQTVDFAGPGDADTINRYAVTDERRWRALFAPGARSRHRGEGSVTTLYYAPQAIESIRAHCPDVKLIALLRDPVDRAFSAYSYLVGRGWETETFQRALELEEERRARHWHHLWHYTRMGFYSRQLAPFIEAFGRDRLLVIGYEDLVADPAAHLRRIFAFLDLDQHGIDELGAQVNVGGRPQSRTMTRAMNWLRRHERTRALVRTAVPFRLREWVRRRNLERMELPGDTRPTLESLYAAERDALVALLGDDAPSWAGPR
ncbi:MAG: sulfotransferase [Acidimicrobiales bacterium]|jgi:LPS sulfotransferase NodH